MHARVFFARKELIFKERSILGFTVFLYSKDKRDIPERPANRLKLVQRTCSKNSKTVVVTSTKNIGKIKKHVTYLHTYSFIYYRRKPNLY